MLFKFNNFPTTCDVSLAIKQDDLKHIGFIYKDSDDNVLCCHLAWHLYLFNDDEDLDQYICGEIGLDPTNQKILSAYIESVAKNSYGQVPYGVTYECPTFDYHGVYKPQPNQHGLTCATFVLSVLESFGHFILDKSSWIQRQEDIEWQSFIVGCLQTSRVPVPSEHIDLVRNDIGRGCRLKPIEVFSSGIQEEKKWAVSFEDAVSLAAEISELIAKAA